MIRMAMSQWSDLARPHYVISAVPCEVVAAQGGTGLDKPVMVAIPAVFRGASGTGAASETQRLGGREVQALVRQFDGPDADCDLILLNPAHATPHGLRAALFALRRFGAVGLLVNDRAFKIPVLLHSWAAAVRAEGLSRVLTSLRSHIPLELQGFGAAGWAFFGTVDEIDSAGNSRMESK